MIFLAVNKVGEAVDVSKMRLFMDAENNAAKKVSEVRALD